MKNLLVEQLSPEKEIDARFDALELLEGEIGIYDGKDYSYPDLAVWLAFMRSLTMIHHSHHWQVLGNGFFSDHELLKKLYENVQGEVDGLGEKLVGLDSPALTNYFPQLDHMRKFMEKVSDKTKPPLLVSLVSELVFIQVGELVKNRLKEANLLTTGLENLFGDVLDRHESHVYLLKQRLTQNP